MPSAWQQPRAGATGGSAGQQGIEGVEQDRFAGTGLAGEHREATTELELQLLDQGDVLKAQSGEHSSQPV